jgi:hypothetical protein
MELRPHGGLSISENSDLMRIHASARMRLFVTRDRSDPIDLHALQHQVRHLPAEVILFLLGSRYCETDRLSDEAWRLFGKTPLGWPRVQAICDFVHHHPVFGYEHSSAKNGF